MSPYEPMKEERRKEEEELSGGLTGYIFIIIMIGSSQK
jgi:hypothetical protein